MQYLFTFKTLHITILPPKAQAPTTCGLRCHLVNTDENCQSNLIIVGTGICDLFWSCDLDLDPMTFIYELDTYYLEIYWRCKK